MSKYETVAMLLAGGQGSRLGGLTFDNAKPAVAFGGKYRLIDFSLSNCYNSGIEVVGVLTQYKPLRLNTYIGTGAAWALDALDGGVTILPPYMSRDGGQWYLGTADAVYQNIEYLDYYNPEYVLILSGDHVYKMDYSLMIDSHKEKGADATIAVMPVPWGEASRFGILVTGEDGEIIRFDEKPKNPVSNLASMGVYVFNYKTLRKALIEDHVDTESNKDFGKNIIPKLLGEGRKLYSYRFDGYWRDVGTIQSYYETNMEILDNECPLDFHDQDFPVYSNNHNVRPQIIGSGASICQSLVCDGCFVYGKVNHSILSNNVYVGKGANVKNSIILHNARIEDNASVENAIISEGVVVTQGCLVGNMKNKKTGSWDIEVVSQAHCLSKGGTAK